MKCRGGFDGPKMSFHTGSRRSQPPLALAVPLSRFTSRIGGGSAFYVSRHHAHDTPNQDHHCDGWSCSHSWRVHISQHSRPSVLCILPELPLHHGTFCSRHPVFSFRAAGVFVRSSHWSCPQVVALFASHEQLDWDDVCVRTPSF